MCRGERHRQRVHRQDREADGLFWNPTYFSDVTAGMKALIERRDLWPGPRLFPEAEGRGRVVAVRRAGSIPAFNSLNLFLIYNR